MTAVAVVLFTPHIFPHSHAASVYRVDPVASPWIAASTRAVQRALVESHADESMERASL